MLGEPVDLTGVALDMDDLPPFNRRLYEAARMIPAGRTLTYGELAARLTRLRPFLRSAGTAEEEVVAAPGLLASIGLARPTRLVSTFSLWSSAAAMRDYSYRDGGAHMAAVRADREGPFHHESAFIRFRPYRSEGEWEGRDPLAL